MKEDKYKKIFAIVASVLFPGMGNLFYGQKKLGLILLILSFVLTVFYFIPLLFFLFEDNMRVFLAISGIIAMLAFIADLGCMIYSIIKLPFIDNKK